MKRWIITGCSGGLGRALALAALRRGDAVAGTSRRAGLDLGATQGRWIPVQLDLADTAAIAPAVEQAVEQLGGLDVLVNNAGYALAGAVEEISPAEAQALMAANFFGPLQLMRAALPHLRRSHGRILNISSLSAVQANPGLALYGASKAALTGLSAALAAEVRDAGVHVTSVEPTGFRTSFGGDSLTWASAQQPEYQALRSRMQEGFARSNGRQPNDPAKGAEALLALVEQPDPPVHFGLGFDAEPRISAAIEARLAEYRAFAPLGADTAFARAKGDG